MDRGCRHLLCCSQDFIDVQIGFRLPDPNCLIAHQDVARSRVNIAVNGDGWNISLPERRGYSTRDFSPIGDEHLHDSQLGFRFSRNAASPS